ncbi:MAG TPA: phasin family protein [Azospirillum sp.]|nr:phasin family protein [Azospirillum sp.]
MTAHRAAPRTTPARVVAMMNDLVRTAGKHGEMGVAAARTIGFRTAMLAETLSDPMSITHPEFVRMGAEKMEATAEAATAMAIGMAELQHAWMALFTGPVQVAVNVSMASLGTCRSPMDVLSIQQRWLEESVTASMDAGMHFVESAASLARAGLPAFHRRTRANARRLARVRRA